MNEGGVRYDCKRVTEDRCTRWRLGYKNRLTSACGEDLPGSRRGRILTLKQNNNDIDVVNGCMVDMPKWNDFDSGKRLYLVRDVSNQ